MGYVLPVATHFFVKIIVIIKWNKTSKIVCFTKVVMVKWF